MTLGAKVSSAVPMRLSAPASVPAKMLVDEMSLSTRSAAMPPGTAHVPPSIEAMRADRTFPPPCVRTFAPIGPLTIRLAIEGAMIKPSCQVPAASARMGAAEMSVADEMAPSDSDTGVPPPTVIDALAEPGAADPSAIRFAPPASVSGPLKAALRASSVLSAPRTSIESNPNAPPRLDRCSVLAAVVPVTVTRVLPSIVWVTVPVPGPEMESTLLAPAALPTVNLRLRWAPTVPNTLPSDWKVVGLSPALVRSGRRSLRILPKVAPKSCISQREGCRRRIVQ